MGPDRPLASLSLDLDNLWAYTQVHEGKPKGDAGASARPSYLDTVTPRLLDLLDRLGLTITVFVVGADAAAPANGPALRRIAAAGHEIGNHSFEHEPWLHRYAPDRLRAEIRTAHDAIAQATGRAPEGFRGPGFSWSPLLLRFLAEAGYRYDASTLPTFLGPLARAFYFRSAGPMTDEEREQRKGLFGAFSDGFRPVRPYYWQLDGGTVNGAAGERDLQLLEIPVTTMPVFKTPFHFSYLAFLSRYSEALMMAYLHTALAMCRLTATEPSFLLHPTDIVGADVVPELHFMPGMEMPSERKVRLLTRVLGVFAEHFRIVPVGEHATAYAARQRHAFRPAV